MAEVVNLRTARKARQRSEREALAASNRAKFGQSKAEKAMRRLDEARSERIIDGAKRETD